jgi:hypothetical protein
VDDVTVAAYDGPIETRGLPWAVRYALAAHDAGKPLPPWLLMSVQYVRHGFGCSACHGLRAA